MGLRKGAVFTEEHKQNISKSRTNTTHSDETKLKISQAHLNSDKVAKRKVKVTDIDTGAYEVFDSALECANNYGVTYQTIWNKCTNNHIDKSGDRWEFME